MANQLHDNWISAIEKQPNAAAINEHLDELGKLLKDSTTEEQLLDAFSSNVNSSILLKDPTSNNIVCAHHVSTIGGQVFRAHRSLVGVIGDNAISSSGVVFDQDQASTTNTYECPKFNSLKTQTTATAFDDLPTPSSNPIVFKGKPIIMIPPLIASIALSSPPSSGAMLAIKAIQKLTAIDSADGTNHLENSRRLLSFLWASSDKAFPTVSCTPVSASDNLATAWYQELAIAKLSTIRGAMQHANPVDAAAMASVATNLGAIGTHLEKNNLDAADRLATKERDKSKFSKFLPGQRKWYALLRTKNDQSTLVEEPTEDFDKLLRLPSATSALGHMIFEIENKVPYGVHLEPNLVTSVLASQWQWTNHGSPSNFTIFSMFWKNPDPSAYNPSSKKVSQKMLVQSFTDTTQDSATITFITSESLCCPRSQRDLLCQLQVARHFFSIILGPTAAIAGFVKKWERHVQDNEATLEVAMAMDNLLGARIIYTVDWTVQRYFREAKSAVDMTDLDYAILSTTMDFNLLDRERFVQDLPAAVATVLTSSSSSGAGRGRHRDDDTKQHEGSAKREKLVRAVDAKNSHASWRLPADKPYFKVFPRDVLLQCPKVKINGDEVSICNILHQLGECSRKGCKFHHGKITPQAKWDEYDTCVKAQHAKSL